MKTIKLSCEVVDKIDPYGFNFYLEYGESFDFDYYCECYNIILNEFDVDYDSVSFVQYASSRLYEGYFLLVTHEVESSI